MKYKNSLILFLLTTTASLFPGALPDITKKLIPTTDKLFVGVVEQREGQLKKLKEDQDEFLKTKEELELKIKATITETNNQREVTQKKLKEFPDDEFLQKKLTVLNETFQVLKDIQRAREQVRDTLNDLIRLVSDYLEDPDFASFKQDRKLSERSFYFFEDLQKIHEQISDYAKRIILLTDQEKTIQTELDNRVRSASATKEAYKARRKELEALGQKTNEQGPELSAQQVRDLIDLEETLFSYRTMLDGLRIQEMEYKKELFEMQSFLTKSHNDIHKEYLRLIKPKVRVIEADIVDAQEDFTKKKAEYYATKEKLQKELDVVTAAIKKKESEVEELSKKFNVSLGQDLNLWDKEPRQTVDSYVGLSEVGTANTELLSLEQQRGLLEAQMVLEDQKFEFAEFQVKIKQSYHKFSAGKFSTEEDISQERKKYEAPLAETKRLLAQYKERITLNAELLNNAKRVIDNITQLKKDIEAAKETAFKGHTKAYSHSLELLKRADELEKEQINILTKLTGVYSGITSSANNMIRLLEFITSELEARTILYRPEHAIPWEGIKNIIPDMVSFLNDVRGYIIRLSIPAIFEQIREVTQAPDLLFWLIVKLILVIVVLGIIRFYLPSITKGLLHISESYAGLIRIVSLLLASMCSFATKYFVLLALWAVMFGALWLQPLYLTNAYILFYLLSIPYWLFITNKFIRYMAYFNIRHDYAFLAPEFQRRFVLVISGLAFSSIVILFFRAAFMLANYPLSDLPTILLALNFIIFQISLYLLIDKEQILHLIPTRTPFWQWIHDQVNNYYFIIQLCVIAIIIMTNPYVGFSKLVLYIIFGFIYTALLITILFWLHGAFKRISSEVFFSTRDDVVRERFSHAKTWFGFLIIVSFLFLTALGIIITARIWGWQITMTEIKMVLSKPIMGDPKNPITLISLFHILLFVLGGYLVSYALNRFVLDKIFDLLLVDAGVQHTITSILQYLVLATALFLGFNYANLGSVVNYIIGALILGLSWMLKDPIGDFIAYFIILVQRPIKIGDYIKVDADTMGVVRKITARSVVLRRKNSVTIIVPNTYVISHSVQNWNYARNFFAFDDIMVHVDFREDPEEVIQLLKAIIEEQPNILKNPKPIVRLQQFTDYGYEFSVRGFLSSIYTLEQWEIASNIRVAIVREFRKKGIEFALPIRMMVTKKEVQVGGIPEDPKD